MSVKRSEWRERGLARTLTVDGSELERAWRVLASDTQHHVSNVTLTRAVLRLLGL